MIGNRPNQKRFGKATNIRMHLNTVNNKPAALWKQCNEKNWAQLMKMDEIP